LLASSSICRSFTRNRNRGKLGIVAPPEGEYTSSEHRSSIAKLSSASWPEYLLDTQPEPHAGISVLRATAQDREDLEQLVAQIEAEDHPSDIEAALHAPEGMARSLDCFDALSCDSAWFLIARLGDCPVGLAVCTRIPKLDDRIGFLYLDEIHALSEHRRQGIGTALMRSVADLAKTLGLAGVRLLTEPDNRAAQDLYNSLGGQRSKTLLYQIPVVPRDSSL